MDLRPTIDGIDIGTKAKQEINNFGVSVPCGGDEGGVLQLGGGPMSAS